MLRSKLSPTSSRSFVTAGEPELPPYVSAVDTKLSGVPRSRPGGGLCQRSGNAQSGFYAGLHTVQGVDCHHLVFRQADIDWQIWIDAGLMPLPRKLLITYKDEPGFPRYTGLFSDWDLSPELGDSVFRFVPHEGDDEIEFGEPPE